MSDPVRLINRSGLASALLRAGSEERPSNARLRQALSTLGAAAAVSSLTGEAAGGGAGALASGALGSALTKAGAGSVSVVLAAKWVGIGSLGALVAVGATEISSRMRDQVEPRAAHVVALPQPEPSPRPPLSLPSSKAREVTEAPADVIGLAAPAEVLPRLSVERPVLPSSGRSDEGREGSPFAEPRMVAAAPIHSSGVAEVQPSHEPALEPSASSSPARSADLLAREDAPVLTENVPPGPRSMASSQAQLRLAKEVSLVDRAWAAMRQNDLARALAELADYEEQFPELGLHPEVLFVRMEAEERLGRVAAAKLQAARIVASYPKSAQAGRARALLNRR